VDVAQLPLTLNLLAQVAPGLETLLSAGSVEQSEGGKTKGNLVLSDSLDNRLHKLERETATVLRGASVFVGTLVGVGVKELVDDY
jgi:hypothetical protein